MGEKVSRVDYYLRYSAMLLKGRMGGGLLLFVYQEKYNIAR